MPALPFKLTQDRRRHIPEQKRKVVNWREYDESLRRRGSLMVWFSDEAVEAWEAERRTSRGGQPAYSDLAILTALTFRAVFATVLHRIMMSGSDRACEKWMADYAISGVDELTLHHLYRAMAWLGEELPADQQGGATPFAPRAIKDLVE